MLSITSRGKPVTKLARTGLAVTFALLLSAGIVGKARHAYAQDADETDQSAGSWGAPDADGSDVSEHKVKPKMLNLKGCWSGDVMDAGDDLGTATFEFDQNSNLKKLLIGSTFNFQWPDSAYARGPMKGSVSPTGFKFKGNAGRDCAVTGSGAGDDSALTGTFVFTGSCATTFEDVTFSITPGCP
jgi:hypothetical protein